jgi:hypothetical protein
MAMDFPVLFPGFSSSCHTISRPTANCLYSIRNLWLPAMASILLFYDVTGFLQMAGAVWLSFIIKALIPICCAFNRSCSIPQELNKK